MTACFVPLQDSLLLTYLDVSGRPVISVTKTNLVENHIQEFRIGYRFPVWMTVREPLMVVAAFLLLFLLVIIYVRLDFSISKVRPPPVLCSGQPKYSRHARAATYPSSARLSQV